MFDLSSLGLVEPPFSLSPDPRYFYISLQHKATLGKVTYVVEQRQGISVIFGDVGVGKTTERIIKEHLVGGKVVREYVIVRH